MPYKVLWHLEKGEFILLNKNKKAIKKRLGSGMLILTIMMCSMVGFASYSASMLAGSTFNTLESSGVALKAQQLAKNRADEIFVLSYKKMDDAAEVRKNIPGTNLYRETVVTPGEITNPDGTKQRELSVKIYKNDTDITPIFSLPLVRTKGINPPGVPVGTVIWFAGINPPEGFLVCNGQATTGYPELASVVGSSVPNLQGAFIRGYGSQTVAQNNGSTIGITPTVHQSGNFGELQGDAIRNITGNFNADIAAMGVLSTGGAFADLGGVYYGDSGDSGVLEARRFSFDSSRIVPTANENRPVNVALLPCIKHD